MVGTELQGFILAGMGKPSIMGMEIEYSRITTSGSSEKSDYKIGVGQNFTSNVSNNPVQIHISGVVFKNIFGLKGNSGVVNNNHDILALQGLRILQNKTPLMLNVLDYAGPVILKQFIKNTEKGVSTYELLFEQTELIVSFQKIGATGEVKTISFF
jgi:hypothetical protein